MFITTAHAAFFRHQAFILVIICNFALSKKRQPLCRRQLNAAGGKSGQHRVTILPNGKGLFVKTERHSKCHRKQTAYG